MPATPKNNYAPKRIVSVVPSQTELLYDLGLRDEVVGITKFCIHPADWFRSKPRIGGTKNLHIDRIQRLNPDLILCNKEENTKEQIEALQRQYPVYMSDIHNFPEAIEMIRTVGSLVHRSEEAEVIIENILSARNNMKDLNSPGLKTLYLIWYKPYMAAGTDTFIHAMLDEAGLENCVTQNRYPVLTHENIKALSPKLVLLSSEPFPFRQQHLDELRQLLPDATIKLVDGELFSWYGSRMSRSFEYFRALNEELR